MGRPDWTPVVLVTATLSTTVVAGVLLTSPWLLGTREPLPGAERALRRLAPEVAAWVGEVEPGLKAVLAPVWGEPGADRAHDETLNDALGLAGDRRLAFYRLLLLNLGEAARTLDLDDGALAVRGPDGGPPVALLSLAGLVERGEAKPSRALAVVLGGEGALRRRVEVPPAHMAVLLVALTRRVDLGAAVEVAAANGAGFHLRRMSRRDLETLLARPEAGRVEEL